MIVFKFISGRFDLGSKGSKFYFKDLKNFIKNYIYLKKKLVMSSGSFEPTSLKVTPPLDMLASSRFQESFKP